jgi:hypothetical protein
MIDKLVIDEKRWARGGVNGAPCLLNKQNTMCCLGFLGVACGVSEEHLRGYVMPALQLEMHAAYPKIDNEIYGQISVINDELTITDEDRKKSLTIYFKNYLNIELTFE